MWGRTRYYFTSLHTQDSHGNTINTKKTRIEDIEGYHIYAMDWSKDKIDFFVDNNLVYTFNPENKTEAFGLIINPSLLSIWQLVEVLEDRMLTRSFHKIFL
jgi:beta-glucanase (GH16 family)